MIEIILWNNQVKDIAKLELEWKASKIYRKNEDHNKCSNSDESVDYSFIVKEHR